MTDRLMAFDNLKDLYGNPMTWEFLLQDHTHIEMHHGSHLPPEWTFQLMLIIMLKLLVSCLGYETSSHNG